MWRRNEFNHHCGTCHMDVYTVAGTSVSFLWKGHDISDHSGTEEWGVLEVKCMVWSLGRGWPVRHTRCCHTLCNITFSLCSKFYITQVIFSAVREAFHWDNKQIRVMFCPHLKGSTQAAVSGGDKIASWILPWLLSKMIRARIKSLAETLLPADFTMQAMKFIAEAKQGQ